MNIKKIVKVIFIIFVSFLLAYFVDQYYIAGKGWGFILELLK